MRSLILIIFLFLTSKSLLAQDWTGITDCGLYQVKGVGSASKEGLTILVNENTQSEFSIKVPIQNEAFLAPYIKKSLEARVLFEKKPHALEINGIIKEIKSRIPNPLDPKDTGIKLITKVKCK